MPEDQPILFPDLEAYLGERNAELGEISTDRRVLLEGISSFVRKQTTEGRPARLIFICTHNSRRSHMAQLWAQVAAAVWSVPGVETFSGGTETTAFNPRSVAALVRAGFRIELFTDGANPIYETSWEPEAEPLRVFSKVFDEPPNPTEDFAAVMTCSSADAACPVVVGAAERIAIPYDDPKAFDGTEQEASMYDERCAQIAREMLWVFAEVTRERLSPSFGYPCRVRRTTEG